MKKKNVGNIGKLIKDAREKKQLTQAQLARKVGKKRSYISRIEGAHGDNIKLQTLITIVEDGLEGSIQIKISV